MVTQCRWRSVQGIATPALPELPYRAIRAHSPNKSPPAPQSLAARATAGPRGAAGTPPPSAGRRLKAMKHRVRPRTGIDNPSLM